MQINKEEYLEIVKKLEKMQEALKPRVEAIADAVVKSGVTADLKEARREAIRYVCSTTQNELSKLLINDNFLESCRTRNFYISDLSIHEHVFYFNIDVWENNPVVLPSIVIYGSNKDFKEYLKGLKANLNKFLANLRTAQNKILEEELIEKMVFE